MLEGLADRNRSEGLLDADAEVGDPGVPLAPVSQLPGVPGLRDHRLSRRGDAPPAEAGGQIMPAVRLGDLAAAGRWAAHPSLFVWGGGPVAISGQPRSVFPSDRRI